ncbi:MAG: nucleoside deaminase [Clostridia bacterium]|nr:nucleoside deaminase [Clostridia bacterium]
MKMDERFMQEALAEARLAAAMGEVPVGAVIVREGEIIARAHNTRETEKNALHHAEILAIEAACRHVGGWRLTDCTLYVTLEPCPMCGGAILNARLGRVVYGAKDASMGVFGSVLNYNAYPLGYKVPVTYGVLETESRALLQAFFEAARKRKKR